MGRRTVGTITTVPRNGGGFAAVPLCVLRRFPRNVRISEDCDQSRCLLASATSDAEPLSLSSLSDLLQVRAGLLRCGSGQPGPGDKRANPRAG